MYSSSRFANKHSTFLTSCALQRAGCRRRRCAFVHTYQVHQTQTLCVATTTLGSAFPFSVRRPVRAVPFDCASRVKCGLVVSGVRPQGTRSVIGIVCVLCAIEYDYDRNGAHACWQGGRQLLHGCSSNQIIFPLMNHNAHGHRQIRYSAAGVGLHVVRIRGWRFIGYCFGLRPCGSIAVSRQRAIRVGLLFAHARANNSICASSYLIAAAATALPKNRAIKMSEFARYRMRVRLQHAVDVGRLQLRCRSWFGRNRRRRRSGCSFHKPMRSVASRAVDLRQSAPRAPENAQRRLPKNSALAPVAVFFLRAYALVH